MASVQHLSPPSSPDIPATVSELRRAFDAGRLRSESARRAQLERLRQMIVDREGEILEAVRLDLGKGETEGWLSETGYTLGQVEHALEHLTDWLQPTRVPTPLAAQPGVSEIHTQPLGVVLIIGPWNYPFQLVVAPLVGALAAGNCAVLKPSELTPHTSSALRRAVQDYLDPEVVRVVEGDATTATALLAERFDHIFFTGGSAVGRVIMQAAAKHLTPVTLELGGKSPCIVDDAVNLDVAIRRICIGKFFNAGQTCVAPDYLLVHRARLDEVLGRLGAQIRAFYGEDPKASPDYGRIVNERHFGRLTKLLQGAGRVVVGGQNDAASRYFAPTVVTDVPLDAPLMQEEIFGPILPVCPVADVDEAIAFINARPKPLALYLFSKRKSAHEAVLQRTSSGDACINDVWVYYGVHDLPFGGVGESGMGAYHGHQSYLTFSHRRGVLTHATWGDAPVRYPPYSASKLKWLKRLV